MFSSLVMEGGLMREVQVILTLYLGTLLGGFSVGFSSSALPGIREEWDINNAGAKLVLTKATEYYPYLEIMNGTISTKGLSPWVSIR